MKLGAISSALFAVTSIATSLLSAQMLGTGMWGWIILGSGIIVGISPYQKALSRFGKALALVISVIAIGAVLLGLAAATAGGSFRLEGEAATLISLFAALALSGLIYGWKIFKT